MRLHGLERLVLLNPLREPLRRIFEAPRMLEGVKGRCLDIGTGAGGMLSTAQLEDGVEGIIGADIDPELLRRAREMVDREGLDKAQLVLADATMLPFADASFDTVLMTGVMHHIVGWERVLREAHRLLSANGRLVLAELVTSRLPEAMNRFLGHSHLSIPSLEDALRKEGFAVERMDRILGGVFVMVWARRAS